jgi:nitronate monooxygenase
MHFVAYAALVAAVSNAGALGTLTALTQKSPEDLRKEIAKVRSLLVPRMRDGKMPPFAVNFTLLPALMPPDYDAYARVIVECKVPVVETAGANPGKFIALFKKHGITVVHKCTTIRHALAAEKLGADAVSIDGFECAGHPGTNDVGAMVLLAKARETLRVPFLACGGVGTGRQLAAALALGADGVCMGTRFMATVEAPIMPGIKRALVEGDENSTTLVMTTVKNHERVYKNRVAEEVRAIEAEKPGDFSAIHHLVRGENYRKSFQETGDAESSVWSAGCVMGLIDDAPTCRVLVDRIVAEAVDVISRRLNTMITLDSSHMH